MSDTVPRKHWSLTPFLTGLRLFDSGTCLASMLARSLTSLPAADLRHTQVILPTARLANRISATACQLVGAWYEPSFLTLESFVNVQAARCQSDVLPLAADDVESSLLLGHLIRHSSYRHVNHSHIGELKQLFNEFADWRFGVAGFERIRGVLAENTFRSDEAIANLYERVDEAEDLFNRFLGGLQGKGKIPARQRQVLVADILTEEIESGLPSTSDRILMAGITSVMPWSHRLLAAMAKHWPLQVWAPMPQSCADIDPVNVLTKVLGFAPEQTMSAEESVQVKKSVTIQNATDVFAETAAALNLVDAAVKSGVKPVDIGVLVTNDHEYGRPLRVLLKQFPHLAINVAITKPFSSCLSGSWLASVRQLHSRGEDAAALTSFLTHAVTVKKLNDLLAANGPVLRPVPHIHDKKTLREDLIRELCRAGIESGLAATSEGIGRKNPRLSAAINAVHAKIAPLLNDDLGLSVAEWGCNLQDILAWFAPVHLEDPERPGLRLSVQAAIDVFLLTVAKCVISGEKIDAGVFLDMVAEHLLASDIRDTGDQLKGVQILSIEEARFVPFKLLLILGCNEGSFPRSLPKDYLFDNFIKIKIGLPGWRAVEAIEDSTFHLLKARTANLQLFYSENPTDGLKIRSRFIDDIKKTNQDAVFKTVNAAEALHSYIRADKLKQIELATAEDRQNRRNRAGAFLGNRQALLEKLSATSLEALIKCPYRFLLRQLGVRELDIPEEDDRRKEGDWLHGVLEAFFTGSWNEREIAQPLDTGIANENFYQYAKKRLETLTARICPPELAGTETWVQARTIGWPAFARHIAKLYEEGGLSRIGLGQRELKYKSQIPLDPQYAFAPVFSGKIDSIDIPLPGVHLVTDYKRSAVPEKNTVLAGDAPQLTLYAAALHEMSGQQALTADKSQGGEQAGTDASMKAVPGANLSNTIIGYWSILKGEFSTIAAGSTVKSDAEKLGLMSMRTKGQLEDVFAHLRHVVAKRRETLIEGKQIVPDTKDCSFCGFSGICRKDDPEFRSGVPK